MAEIQNRIISFLLRHPEFFYQNVYFFFPLTDKFLTKYGHVVNWPKISSNLSLINNWDFIERYKDMLDWENLSLEHINWNEYYVEKYLDRIHWKAELKEIVPGDYYTIDTFSTNPSFTWNLNSIEKYQNLICWPDLSRNENQFWNDKILDKFKEVLDWNELSFNDSVPISEELLCKFDDKWNWDNIFRHKAFCSQKYFIEKYPEQIDWFNVCNGDTYLINDSFIEKWHNKVHWRALAGNENFINSDEKFNQYMDKWYAHDCFISLSGNKQLPWSIEFIEKYINEWDWEMLSMNEGLPWSESLINRFEDRLKFGKNEPISPYESISEFGIRDLRSFPWSIDFLEKNEHKWKFEDFNPNKELWNKAFKPYVDQDMIDLIFRILQ